MNKKVIIGIVVGIITLLLVGIALYLFFRKDDGYKEYKNDYFKVKYDTSWKVVEDKKNLELKHKKTNSTFKIQYKVLDDNYMDTDLSSIRDNIVDSIINQNEGYELINTSDNVSKKYEAYSYLYEKDDDQVLVNIYKKDNVLVILYYNALSKYFDIVLDSADTIIDSLEIYSGEK